MTAHDVRHLTTCCLCGQLGDDRDMAFINGEKHPAHGGCILKAGGIALLVSLPKSETGKLRLDDIGPDAMKALFDRSQS